MQNFVVVASVVLAVLAGSNMAAPNYGGYAQPGPSYSYSYPSPPPAVKCGGNLLVGCHPSVASVPCSSYSAPSYSAPSYSAPAYHAPAPAYHAPAPAYHAPAPSYSAPSYSKPSY